MTTLLASNHLQAQEPLDQPYCATLQPGNEVPRSTLPQRHSGITATLEADIATIPVVVHVVYNTAEQNIPDSQIVWQIEQLNRDFRRKNADTPQTPAVFEDVAADVAIEFCLAARDPDGLSTDGILRRNTSVEEFGTNDEVKSIGTGGIDPWPTNRYLNIWVCNLTGNLRGYAQMPGGNPTTDGVVIDYAWFGQTDTVPPYGAGRTATHHIGHWLGLLEVSYFDDSKFINGCVGTSPTTCAARGDRICDTPPTFEANTGCPETQNTCTVTPEDLPDQTMNFMDQTHDTCQNLFTTLQGKRMHGFLNGARFGIRQNAIACVPLTAHDLGVTQIIVPSIHCSTNLDPLVEIFNYGTDTISQFEVHYKIDAEAVQTHTVSQTLRPLESLTVSLPAVTVAAGSHLFMATTVSPDGQPDTYPGNDTLYDAFVVDDGNLSGLYPYLQDFEKLQPLQTSFGIENPDNSIGWRPSHPLPGHDSLSTVSLFINHFRYDDPGQLDVLTTYPIDLTQSNKPVLEFHTAYARYSTFYEEAMTVLISADCGNSYDTLWHRKGSELTTMSTSQTQEWYPSQAGHWRQDCADLNAYKSEQIILKVVVENGYGNNLFIDNLRIGEGSCLTGVANATKELSGTVYPNPSGRGVFTLDLHDNILTFPVRAKVYDLTGRQVWQAQWETAKNKYLIDIGDDPPGFYVLQLTGAHKQLNFKLQKSAQ